MKKILFLPLLLPLLLQLGHAKEVEAILDLCRFQDPSGAPYLEVYLSVDGTSVMYQKEKEGYQASVKVDLKLYRVTGVDTTLTYENVYNLLSQVLPDTTRERQRQAFLDMKRIMPEGGTQYVLKAYFEDNYNAEGSPMLIQREINFSNENKESFAVSDLEFVASITKTDQSNVFVKNGYQIVPFVSNAAYINQNKLQWYQEIYRSDTKFEEPYYAQAVILKEEKPLMAYDLIRKKNPGPIGVFSGTFDISRLPSQSYKLRVTYFSKPGSEDTYTHIEKFFVFNSKVDPDEAQVYVSDASKDLFSTYTEEELDYYLKTLIHISTEQEIRLMRALGNKEDKGAYLASFWEKRAQEGKTATALWNGYVKAIEYTNEQFKSTLRDGWETDRGRVFLTYGIPSDVERFPAESMRLPHEIWKYDRLGAQSQILFVFLDTDLATNEYQLIHSNKYGEIQNWGWQQMLFSGDTQNPVDPINRDVYEENRVVRPGN
ncbi:MAG: GWxTD domain-containing protein [Bacteroidota bacterium]